MKRACKGLLVIAFFSILIVTAFLYIKPIARNNYSEWAKNKLGNQEEYSVIVVGSDPEGITAAIAAARSGAKTLLLGKEPEPGGLFTYGMLNTLDMNRNDKGELLTKGIFSEFYAEIGSTESFDVKKAKEVFKKLISDEVNLTYLYNYKFEAPIMNGNTIVGVKMLNPSGEKEEFKGLRIIDATQDGDVSAAAGASYYIGMNDINWNEKMAATLVFRVGGIDWKQLSKDITKYKEETNDLNVGINRSTAWAFGEWCYENYKPVYPNMKLRGLNMGLQEDSTVLINALQIFDVDPMDKASREKAIKEGAEEVENVMGYLRNKLESFKNAYIVEVSDDLYIRESRHIQGEYVLTATDILGNTNFNDKIALGSYPIDIQSTDVRNSGYVIGAPAQYSIPLRCIIPLNVENLLIVGKAASYSSVAAGSARVVPIGMVVGESAGVTAVYSIAKNITPREISKDLLKVKELVKTLKSQGIYLPEFDIEDPNANVIGYSQIKKFINLGFLSGGYKNDFEFEKEGTIGNFSMAIVNGLQRGGKERYNLDAVMRITSYSNKRITGVEAARIIATFLGENPEDVKSSFLVKEDLIIEEKEAFEKMSEEEKTFYNSLNQTQKSIYAKMKSDEREMFATASDESKKGYEIRREEELKKEAIQKDAIWALAEEKGYFSKMREEITKDQILKKKQVYELAVNILETYLGRKI